MGASNKARNDRPAFNDLLMAVTRRMADSESPPKSKNDSSIPTRSRPRTCAKAPASTSSTAVTGARNRLASLYSGAGRARVSSLPLTVSGNAAITTTADGTMKPGSRPASAARASAASIVPVT
ncbi:hypothetical protein A9X03_05000 [Mycobacterium sp. E1715]|nr:hypothetical protein A9X03_05000 [Mycobacterium sp. E1715]